MRTGWRRILCWVMGVTALFLALMAAFRMELGEDGEDPLAIADVAGVWQGSDGGRLMVRADGSADLDGVTRPGPDCGQSTDGAGRSYTGPAARAFDTYPDERPGIRFDHHGPATAKPFRIYLVVSLPKDGTKGILPKTHPACDTHARPAGRTEPSHQLAPDPVRHGDGRHLCFRPSGAPSHRRCVPLDDAGTRAAWARVHGRGRRSPQQRGSHRRRACHAEFARAGHSDSYCVAGDGTGAQGRESA